MNCNAFVRPEISVALFVSSHTQVLRCALSTWSSPSSDAWDACLKRFPGHPFDIWMMLNLQDLFSTRFPTITWHFPDRIYHMLWASLEAQSLQDQLVIQFLMNYFHGENWKSWGFAHEPKLGPLFAIHAVPWIKVLIWAAVLIFKCSIDISINSCGEHVLSTEICCRSAH